MLIAFSLLETSVWDKASVIAAIVAAGLLALVLFAQIWSTRYTRRAANAARDAAEEARASNERANEEANLRLRPYLVIDRPDIVAVSSTSGVRLSPLGADTVGVPMNQSWPDDSVVTLEFPFTNFGEFPALVLKTLRVTSFSKETVENFLRDNARPDGDPSVFIPHKTDQLALDIEFRDIKRIRGPNPETMYIGAAVIYEDRLREQWIVESVFEFSHLTIRNLRQTLPQRFPKSEGSTSDVDAVSEGTAVSDRRLRHLEILDLVTVMFALLFLGYSVAGLWVALNRPNNIVALVAGAIFGALLFANVVGRWKRKS